MKKLLLILIGVLLSLPALAADGDNFSYTYQGQTLTYTILSETDKTVETKEGVNGSAGNNVSGDLILPEKVIYNNIEYTLISIGSYAFYKCDRLTSVEIPNSVTSIGESAFNACFGLKSIEIPNSVTEIGGEAFNGCINLTSVIIGKSVTEIGEYAFSFCPSLKKSAYPNTIKDPFGLGICVQYPADNSEIEEGIIYGKDKSAIWFVPLNYEGDFNIPNSVKSIGDNAFAYCSSLTSVIIPNSVTEIGSSTFEDCTGLIKSAYPNTFSNPFRNGISVQYPADNSEFEEGIIYGKDKSAIWFVPLNYEGDFNIPNSVTSIGDGAFYSCTGLTGGVEIPNSVTEIRYATFAYCSGLKSVDIPNSVKSIGEYAFYSCSSLTSVIIPNSVTSLGEYAFEDCTGLTGVTIGNSVTEIGSYAFSGCTGLTKVNITDIAKWCEIKFEKGEANPLYYVHNLYINDELITDLVIPSTVTSIGSYAFYGCTSLKSVEIPNSVTEIGRYAFSECTSLTKVNITDIAKWCEIKFEKGEANPLYYVHNLYINDELITDLVIPSTVTSIGSYAFYGCNGLTDVEIPNSVTSIDDSAFSGCTGLKNVVIGEGLNSIGQDVFYNCPIETATINCNNIPNNLFSDKSSLKSLILGNSVNSIGNYAFKGCTALTSVEINNSVTEIGNETFYGCSSMTSLAIGEGLTSSGQNVFKDCPIEIATINCKNVPKELFSGLNSANTLVLGNSVKSIGDNAFADCTEIEKVTCLGRIPPLADKNIFSDVVYRFTSLYVPDEYLNNYKTTDPWSNFFEILGGAGVSAILDNPNSVVTVYSTGGFLIKKDCKVEDLKLLDKGIYIIVSGKQRYKISI